MVTFAWACEALGSIHFGDHLTDPLNATSCSFCSLPGRSCLQKLPASPSKALVNPGGNEALGERQRWCELEISRGCHFHILCLSACPLLHPNSSFRPAQSPPSTESPHPTPSFLLGRDLPSDSPSVPVPSSPRFLSANTQGRRRATEALTEATPHRPLKLTSDP